MTSTPAPLPPFKFNSTKTALAIILPASFQPEINALRCVYDKAYYKWAPHINILYPFVEPSSLATATAILRSSLLESRISSIPMKLDDVGAFKHKRNATVFLKPSQDTEERLKILREQLVKPLECVEGEGLRDGEFKPHLTVGQAGYQGDQLARLEEKVRELMGVEWECTSLAVLRREDSGEMKLVEELKLAIEGDEAQDDATAENEPCD